MAKGKYAARSTKRQVEAQDQHIDRLTDRLAEAKIRARRHELDAELVPHLRKRIEELERQAAEDTVVAELVDRINGDVETIKRLNHRIGALRQALLDALRDLNWNVLDLPGPDIAEYVCQRWPDLFSKEAGRDVCLSGLNVAATRRLSDEAVRRIQVVRGDRVPSPEGAQPIADLLVETFTAHTRAQHDTAS